MCLWEGETENVPYIHAPWWGRDIFFPSPIFQAGAAAKVDTETALWTPEVEQKFYFKIRSTLE